MPLQKQIVPISFSQGINTGSDDKQLIPGELVLLENAVFSTINKISKRFGFESLSQFDTTNTLIQNPRSIATFNAELNLYNDKRFYGYSDAIDRWVDKGRAFNILPNSFPILRNSYEQSVPACATQGDISVYAWEDSRGGIRCSVLDSSNNSFFISDQLVTSSGANPRVVFFSDSFYIYYTVTTTVRFRKIQKFLPTTIQAEVTPVSNLDSAAPCYDVLMAQNALYIAYNSTAANKLQVKAFNDMNVQVYMNSAAETASESIDISIDSSNRIVIAYASATEVKLIIYNLTLAMEVLAPTIVETIASVNHVTVNEGVADNYSLVYEIDAAATYNHFLKKSSVTLLGVVTAPSVLIRSASLASQMYKIDETNYFNIIHESALQSGYFVADTDGHIVCKISPEIGGKNIPKRKLSPISYVDESTVLYSSQVKGRVISEGAQLFSLLGVNSTIIDFNPDTQHQDRVLGENLLISGGILEMYDGKSVVEHGFHLYPENLAAGANTVTGGFMSDGQYQYVAVYAWVDNRGQMHRSATSIPLTVTTAAGGALQTQAVVVPTLRLTEKTDVIIELYRTEASGEIFYKVTSNSAPTFNDKTVDTVTIVDTLADSTIIGNELLYTTGDILDNDPAPSSSINALFDNRIFLGGLEENELAYSKILDEGAPVAFSSFLRMPIEPDGGRPTALANMDDKLIIFKKTRIYFISGNGPTNAGSLDQYSFPQKISTDVGCVEPNSVVLMPEGLMFKSTKGIYLLTRGLTVEYLGKRVEKFNDLAITSAITVGDTNQVRFTTGTGTTLVYDYLMNQWSVFTNFSGLDSDIVNNTYYRLAADSKVKRELKNVFTDDGQPIKINLETGWLSFTGLQGFARVYRMEVLGSVASKHKLKVKVAYDYGNSFTQQVTINSDDFTAFTHYGDESPYGHPVGGVYGGLENIYQFEINFLKQKCESIRIRFEEIQDETFGEGLTLSGMTFLVGAKGGVMRMNKNRRYGTR